MVVIGGVWYLRLNINLLHSLYLVSNILRSVLMYDCSGFIWVLCYVMVHVLSIPYSIYNSLV